MPQYNLFGEIEQDVMVQEPEIIPEPEPVFLPRKSKKRKDFEIGKCVECGQLLLDDPEHKLDNERCPACDDRLKARYNQYRNFALVKALRAHKYLKR